MNAAANATDLRRRAEAFAEARDWAQAIACFEEIRRLTPGDADVALQLSYLHSLAGRYRRAREHALEAYRLKPSRPAVLKELVARLRTFNEAEALLACVRGLGALSRIEIPLLLAIAAQLSYLNLQEDALRFLDEARRGDPDYPPTLMSRAQVLIYLGRFDEAESELQRCRTRAPQLPKLYWLLATLGRAPRDGSLAQAMVRLLQRPGLAAEDAAMLGFALHLELDRAGRHAEAWQALMFGCRAKRAQVDYAPAEMRATVEALRRLPIGRGAERGGDVRPRPIFIVGMHRSGTTLLEQLLDANPQVRSIGELYDFTSAMRFETDHHCRGVVDLTVVERAREADFAAVGQRYLDGLAWRIGDAAYFTDKLPSNFLNIGFISQALPNARILHLVRDPVETCFSNLRELFSDANAFSYDLGELADYFGLYRGLMAHWHAALPGRILDVPYAGLVDDTESTMRRVAAFCGLEFLPAMTDPQSSGRAVATASAVQVRQGIRRPSQPKWKPYEAELAPLIQRLPLV
ncbi:tetratricopeptide repeat-containing sulfotransferase family protein [Cognatilysobacter segetis]|uniref:tetratricopeptide repeat-containing sulfotransferase family protein n=1 Tax=Cognatilysobacter segetis TaxID=2492394 RepID=UPI00138FEAC3|nr:sulfotransferase [Lysobacter segetis]